jgi:hypothetical protein
LERVLAGQRVEAKDPVVVMVDFTCPVITYLDRGKSAVALKGEEAESGLKNTETFVDDPKLWMGEVFTARNTPAGNLVTAVKAVTNRWCKQRKAAERDSSAYERREAAMRASRKVSQTKAAAQVMVEAYMKASANDTLPANVRQIMYAARKAIEELSQRPLKDTYFTQTLLPDYITKHQPPWRDNERHLLRREGGLRSAVRTHAARAALRSRLHVDQGTECDRSAVAGRSAVRQVRHSAVLAARLRQVRLRWRCHLPEEQPALHLREHFPGLRSRAAAR